MNEQDMRPRKPHQVAWLTESSPLRVSQHIHPINDDFTRESGAFDVAAGVERVVSDMSYGPRKGFEKREQLNQALGQMMGWTHIRVAAPRKGPCIHLSVRRINLPTFAPEQSPLPLWSNSKS